MMIVILVFLMIIDIFGVKGSRDEEISSIKPGDQNQKQFQVLYSKSRTLELLKHSSNTLINNFDSIDSQKLEENVNKILVNSNKKNDGEFDCLFDQEYHILHDKREMVPQSYKQTHSLANEHLNLKTDKSNPVKMKDGLGGGWKERSLNAIKIPIDKKSPLREPLSNFSKPISRISGIGQNLQAEHFKAHENQPSILLVNKDN